MGRLVLGVAALVAALLTPIIGPADAAVNQVTIWEHTGSQTADSYWQPDLNQPASYVQPNFAEGTAFVRLEVHDKPSDLEVIPSVCFWRHEGQQQFKYETCAFTRSYAFTGEGEYFIELGKPTSWWKKNGVYDWSEQASIGRIMLRDIISGKIVIGDRCGGACYPRDDLDDHIPVQFTAELVMVRKGATLTPLPNWVDNCPTSWSAQCGGGDGGGDPPPPPPPPPDGGSGGTFPSDSGLVPSLTLVNGDGSFDATWSEVAGAGRYQVRYRPVGGKWEWSSALTGRSFSVSGVSNGTEYQVQVRAYANKKWQAWNGGTVIPGAGDGGGDPPPPPPPPPDGGSGGTFPSDSGLVPSLTLVNGDGSFDATWSEVAGAGRYQVRYRPVGGKWEWSSALTGRSFSVSGVSNGTEYQVQVRAYANKKWQAWNGGTVTPG